MCMPKGNFSAGKAHVIKKTKPDIQMGLPTQRHVVSHPGWCCPGGVWGPACLSSFCGTENTPWVALPRLGLGVRGRCTSVSAPEVTVIRSGRGSRRCTWA